MKSFFPVAERRAAAVRTSDPATDCAEVVGLDSEWDEFLASHPDGDLVQSSMWALSKRSLGQRSFLISFRSSGRLLGGALLIERRLPAGLRIGYVARGPIVGKDHVEQASSMVDALVRTARRLGLVALVIQPSANADDVVAALEHRRFRAWPIAIAPEATARIDVTEPDEIILSRMTRTRRKHVRQSLRGPLVIEPSSDIDLFHRLHTLMATHGAFTPVSLEYLRAQWDALEPNDAITMLVARSGGEAKAAMWLTSFGDTLTIRLSGRDSGASTGLHVNEALHFAAIEAARAKGMKYCDLGGLDRPTAETVLAGQPIPDGLAGTHHAFKLELGPEVVLLPRPRFLLLNGIADRLFGSFVAGLVGTTRAAKLAQRLRAV